MTDQTKTAHQNQTAAHSHDARQDENGPHDPGQLAPSTVTLYQTRGRHLWDRAARSLDTSPDALQPTAFADWLTAHLPTVAPNTQRGYRAAALYILQGRPDAEDAMAQLRAQAGENYDDDEDDEDRPGRRVIKRIPPEDFTRLVQHFQFRSRSPWSALLLDWCWAGLLTGLRPAEWEWAALSRPVGNDPSPARLIVRNAKATHGRAVGLTRTLYLDGFTDQHVDHIERLVEAMKTLHDSDARSFPEVYAQVRAAMSRAVRSLWPARQDHYSLYTLRHQFIANAKAAKSATEVAALAGHATDETATRHYGRRRFAWGGASVMPTPTPAQGDVESVRHRLTLFADRLPHVAPSKAVDHTPTPTEPAAAGPGHEDQ